MSTPVFEDTDVKLLPSVEMLTDLFPYEEPTDANHHTHIINPPDNLHIWTPDMEHVQEVVDIARVTEQEVQALCGYRFVPKHNPEKFDACPACMKVAEQLMSENGE